MIETDYLVVGAGAAGMAFTDALIANSDAHVVLVDRRHRPGGHWNDDYGFVRLHQPSAYYGVNSRPLGHDRIDETGDNAGFYERASAAEVCDYYGRVLAEQLLPTGRVRFLGLHDYQGDGSGEERIVSRLTGNVTHVRARRAVVDATYLETTIPSRHKPSFSVEPGVRFLPPNDLVDLAEPAERLTVIGAGKTAMDTCVWLVDQGVAADRIRWIRPRDAYLIPRAGMQPLAQAAAFAEWLAGEYESAAGARDRIDFLRRREERGVVRRLDPEVEPTVYRGAIVSDREIAILRGIRDVVRAGHVTHVGRDRIELEDGAIPMLASEVVVDCSAAALGLSPTKPIFEPGRVTIQRLQFGIDPFSAALIAVVEASGRGIDEKNELCRPVQFTHTADGLADALLTELRCRARWLREPDLAAWIGTTRLSPLRDAATHLTAPAREALGRAIVAVPSAIENLTRITATPSG